jgi:DNA-binding protein HU-beta
MLSSHSVISLNTRRDRIDKNELVRRASRRVGTGTVEEILDATLEEMYEALKHGESVSLRNLGTFYVRPERSSWVFKFNPSQRLRKLFGWSSTYKGRL